MSKRIGYKTDLSDDEWHFTAPYLALIPFDAPQRVHDPREVLNAIRYVVKTGVPWEYLPNEFPPAEIVKAQLQRWLEHHCFENIVHDLRELLRLEANREAQPSHSIVDSRFGEC
jgi:transposase